MSDRPQTTARVPLGPAQALLKGAMRGNAVAVWRDAAEMAENYAAEVEAGILPALDGPETCRQLAAFYRSVAESLSEADAC